MPTEDLPEEVSYEEDTTEEYSFDNLAKGLASGAISRERALKLVGAAILGGVLSTAFPGVAEARKRRRHRRRRALPASPAAPVCPAPAACPNGCCDVDNNCRTEGASSEQFCGLNGVACQTCDSGQECVNGVCACTSASCPNGCCISNSCQVGITPQACGVQGGACRVCGTGTACVNGECVSCAGQAGQEGSGCGQTNAVPPSAVCCAPGQTCCVGALGLGATCCPADKICCTGLLGSTCCDPILPGGGLIDVNVELVCALSAGVGVCAVDVGVL